MRTPWLECFYYRWMISSDGLAEQAYRRLLAGKRTEARTLFELALLRDPASPYRWCDLGEVLLAEGNRAKGRECMRHGAELGPYAAPIHMRAVNFAYRTGDVAWALAAGRRLLSLVDSYDDEVFTVWERMEVPASRIVNSGVPDRRSAQSYFRRLIGRKEAEDAAAAWSWLLSRSYIDDRLADEYAGVLVRRHDYDAAVGAWAAFAGSRENGYPGANGVFNGGFEREPAGTVFDWRFEQVEGARVARDEKTAAEGRCALRLSFDGTQNVVFANVSQSIVLGPGRYRFEARVRTDGITTDEGVGFRIFDRDTPGRLDVRTERLRGTHGWTMLTATVPVNGSTRLLEIQVVRAASVKFDNKLGGTVWIDSVAIRREH